MRCPRCEGSKQESTLKLLTASSPPGTVNQYYDKDGKLHEHGLQSVSSWECSKGHKLTKHVKLGCGGCLEQNQETWT